MNIFIAVALLNVFISCYMVHVSVKKLSNCHNPYMVQIINIAPWLGLISIVLHMTYVAYGSINSIWDVRLFAWQVWDFLVMLLVSRLINVVIYNDKTP